MKKFVVIMVGLLLLLSVTTAAMAAVTVTTNGEIDVKYLYPGSGVFNGHIFTQNDATQTEFKLIFNAAVTDDLSMKIAFDQNDQKTDKLADELSATLKFDHSSLKAGYFETSLSNLDMLGDYFKDEIFYGGLKPDTTIAYTYNFCDSIAGTVSYCKEDAVDNNEYIAELKYTAAPAALAFDYVKPNKAYQGLNKSYYSVYGSYAISDALKAYLDYGSNSNKSNWNFAFVGGQLTLDQIVLSAEYGLSRPSASSLPASYLDKAPWAYKVVYNINDNASLLFQKYINVTNWDYYGTKGDDETAVKLIFKF